MIRFSYLLVFFVIIVSSGHVIAHEYMNPKHSHAHFIPVADEKNMVTIINDGEYRYITSNGIPDHIIGQFPNRSNPNSILPQTHKYRVMLNPQKTGRIFEQRGVIGVALNGIPFEPATAECYGRSRGDELDDSRPCEWREEAIVAGRGRFGLDQNNGHVQPTGAYHYHGIPYGLMEILEGRELVHVGYAADGFPLMVSRSGKYKPGWRMRKGRRPQEEDSPGGYYDGTYTQDFMYLENIGDLDQCNGIELEELGYVYFITEEFPFAPRCLMGQVDQSFKRRAIPPFIENGDLPPAHPFIGRGR